MDFITKLTPSREPITNIVYNSIWVVTDQLTKFRYFIPYREESGVEELAYMFLQTVISNYQIPKSIITD